MSASTADAGHQLFRRTCLNDLQLRPRQKHSGSPLATKDLRLTAGRDPDVDMRAANHGAGVVDQKPPKIFLSGVKLDISGKRKELVIRRNDARSHIAAPSSRSAQAVRGDQYRDRF